MIKDPDIDSLIEDTPDKPLEDDFFANLAEELSDDVLSKLCVYLDEVTKEDIDSRKEWMDSVKESEKYLGFSIEDLKDIPFKNVVRTFDTTFSTALIRFWSTACQETLPSSGPVGFTIIGEANEELTVKAQNMKDWFNYYLTIVDKPYYHDQEKMYLYLGLYGSTFKKVYYDPILKRLISRFIKPTDFVVDNDCNNILDSNRLTHIQYLTKREIILNMQNGIFREVELPYLKSRSTDLTDDDDKEDDKDSDIKLDVYTKRSRFPIYETHAYLDLSEFSNASTDEIALPLPYIITWCKTSMKILSIKPNWEEKDNEYNRINYFIQYTFISGFGPYGLGLAHLIGTNAKTATTILRMCLDAGAYKNLPGGIRAKGFKQQKNDITVGPGEWPEVDTGNLPIRDAFFPLPYSGADQSLMQLRQEIIEQMRDLSSTAELAIGESNTNVPVGTTMALLESSNKIQSAVMRSIHSSMNFEFQLMYKKFREVIDIEQFNISGQNKIITSEDFTDEIVITPISDPSVSSSTQRIMLAESVLKIASSDPGIHDMHAVYKSLYETMGIKDVDKILPLKQEEPQGPAAIDPNQLLMMDIEQKSQETAARKEIASLKAEVDVFKAQLDFEGKQAKIESDKELATLKNQADEKMSELKNEVELLKQLLSDQQKEQQEVISNT